MALFTEGYFDTIVDMANTGRSKIVVARIVRVAFPLTDPEALRVFASPPHESDVKPSEVTYHIDLLGTRGVGFKKFQVEEIERGEVKIDGDMGLVEYNLLAKRFRIHGKSTAFPDVGDERERNKTGIVIDRIIGGRTNVVAEWTP